MHICMCNLHDTNTPHTRTKPTKMHSFESHILCFRIRTQWGGWVWEWLRWNTKLSTNTTHLYIHALHNLRYTQKTSSCLIPRDDIFTNYAESVFLWIKSSREKQKKPTCFISGITSSHAWIPFLDLVDESVFLLNCLKWVFCYTCPNLSWLIWKKISSCQI